MIHTKTQVIQTDPYVRITRGTIHTRFLSHTHILGPLVFNIRGMGLILDFQSFAFLSHRPV